MNQEQVKALLRMMFNGWILHEQSYEQHTESTVEATRSEEDAMAEACGGDERLGYLLHLFSHWSNDIISVAAHYGLALARKQPDGSFLHADGTLDTLLAGGKLTIVDIEPAPSPDHYWHKGRWNAPEPDIA